MKKIAFYIPNRGFYLRDLSHVHLGNPGIGGSEFSATLIASSLSNKDGYDITMLCDRKGRFPSGLKYKACGCIEGAMEYAEKQHFDFVVVDAKLLHEYILVRFYKLPFIAWANCFVEENEQMAFARHPNLLCVVNVGYHQHLLLKRTCVGHKSTYIYNAVPTEILKQFDGKITPIDKREHNVVYIGSLHEAKGFHCLAKAWPSILKKVPDAQLYVIGSGCLYGQNVKLGKWGIAQQEYEDIFIPYILKDGRILPSIHFMGVMGTEKYEVLNKCKVGVPNPWGVSETFGYTAVEMEFMGCHVTTKKCPGYLDTVWNAKNLYSNENELGDYVVRLLETNTLDYDKTLTFVKKFSLNTIVEKWRDFFCKFDNGKAYEPVKPHAYIKAYCQVTLKKYKSLIKYIIGR